MNAAEVLAELRAAGIVARPSGPDRIRVRPVAALTPELRELVVACKPEIIAILRDEIRAAELAAQQRLDGAFAVWREHVTACPDCDRADLAHRCEEGRGLAGDYRDAWRAVYVVPFAGGVS